MVVLHPRNTNSSRRWFQARQRQSLTKQKQSRKQRRIIPMWTLPSIVSSLVLFYLFIFFPLLSANNANQQCHQTKVNDPICHPPPTWSLQDASQQCSIPRYSLEEFEQKWPDASFPVFYPSPIIVTGLQNPKFTEMTTRANVPNRWDSDMVSLPKADLFSFSGEPIKLKDFIDAPETQAFDLAHSKPYMLQNIQNFSAYHMPPSLAKPHEQRFGIGTVGSGAQWHGHGPGFCEVLHGTKHWALVEPPTQPKCERKFVSRHWFEYLSTPWREDPTKPKLWECTLGPGDAVYFPHHWYHTTVNLDPYTVFVTTFSHVHKDRNNTTVTAPELKQQYRLLE